MKTYSSLQRHSFVGQSITGATLALLVVVAAGCASVNRLREAQDSFNQAAAAENAMRFDVKPSDAVAGLNAVSSGYASALLSLEKLDMTDQHKLQADGLWGTALTLKALAQWRLGMFEKAMATAGEARQNAGDQIYPRDRALMAALPGLIKTDQAYNKILATAPLPDVEALLIGENGAVLNIQSARDLVGKDHPVQIYLIQAQLAAYRNLQVALDRLNNHATVPATNSARIKANGQLKELSVLLNAQNDGDSGRKLVEYWGDLCILDR